MIQLNFWSWTKKSDSDPDSQRCWGSDSNPDSLRLCNPGWNNDATVLWLQQSYSNLKTILFKYKVRLKGITGHIGTAPFTQLFVVLKNMSHAVKVIVSYQVIISTMFQCFNLVQFGEKFAAQKIIPNLKKVEYSTDRCATQYKNCQRSCTPCQQSEQILVS